MTSCAFAMPARRGRDGVLLMNLPMPRLSGATTLRPGYQDLLAAIREGGIEMVLAESLDRFSRDQEHVAAFYKQAAFAGVRIITLAEGEINELHIKNASGGKAPCACYSVAPPSIATSAPVM